MEIVETIEGVWGIEPDGQLRGQGTRAVAVGGETTDSTYTVSSALRIGKGTKVSLIGYYATVDSVTHYLEFVINVTDSKLQLDKVENEVRTNLQQITYTPQVGVVYNCQLKFTSTQVLCILNGSVVLKQTLPAGYANGKHGFGHDGTLATNYSLFNEVYLQKISYYADFADIINQTKAIDPKDIVGKNGTLQDYYDYLGLLIEEASRFIDGETNRTPYFFQDSGVTIIEYFNSLGLDAPLVAREEDNAEWEERATTFYLQYKPVLAITEVAKNTAAIGDADVWVTSTKFRWYSYGYLVTATEAIPSAGQKNIRITYTAGYTKMPSDIKMACTRLVVNLIHKQISDRTSTFVSFQRPQAISFGMPEILTSDINAIINRYKLLGWGEM